MGQSFGTLAPSRSFAHVLATAVLFLSTTICAAQPSNDDPCAATALPVNAACANTAGTNAAGTATAGIPAPGCANYTGRDVWYTLVVPANGAVSVQTTAGGVTDGGMAAYYATACNGTFTLISCDDDNGPGNMPQLDYTCLTPGATLYIRFWRKGAGGGGTFSICAVSVTVPATPANDDPCGATVLVAAASCSYSAGTTAGACGSAFGGTPACGTYAGNDTWYRITTVLPGTISVTTTAGTITDGAMAIYSATACNGTFTLIQCDDNTGPGNMPQVDAVCLAAGTYYVRFWQAGGGTGTFNICATFTGIPANDDPCGATTLAANSSCAYVAGTTVGACNTAAPGNPACGTYTGFDVWYVVTTPSFGSLTLTTTANSITDGAMAVYSATACNGTFTLIQCDDNTGPGNMPEVVTCQPAGTFYVRFWQAGGGTGTFNICAVFVTQPANDDPCGATALAPNTSCTYVAGTTAGACNTATPGNPGCGTYTGYDVWFKVTTTSFGSLSVTTTANTITDGAMAIYSATACNGTFTLIQCDDNTGPGNMPQVDVACVAAGTYYVRFWPVGGGTGTFNICAVFTALPANDDPCGATTLAPNTSCTYVAGTTAGACNTATPGNPGCGTYSGYDVWFKVTIPGSGSLSLNTTAGTITDGAMAVYSATACNGTFTLIQCDNNSGPGSMPQIDLTCRPAGTYYVRFWQAGGGTGTFNICAVFTALPANDDPCGAIALAPNASCSYVAGTTVAACNTAVPGDPGCGSYSGTDVWYTVTTPGFGSLTLNSTAGTITDGAMAVYSATACNGTFTLIDCDDDSGPGAMPQIGLTCMASGTYYVRFWQAGGGGGTFNICAVYTATSGAPANDNPCSATALTVGSSCSVTSGSNTCATNNATPTTPGCGNFNANALDVWYSFTAPANGIAIIETTVGTLADPSMAVYSGTCASLTLVECDADDGPAAAPAIYRSDLTPGATYYVRVWGASGASGTFSICIRTPATPSGYSCTWLFELFDTGGDGWGTSQISVTINGGAPTTYTVSQAFNAVLIGLNIGQVVNVSYTNTGANQGENSYRIRLNAGVMPYFNSGSPPGNGSAFTQTVNCQPPSQSQEDCLGAKTICGGASENANPSTTGNVSDLFSSNYGCLASAERQGLWYIYRMSSGGNVGMTLDPAGNDDYDWAIWGPYSSNSSTGTVCVPASTPVRCSYASGGNTFSPTGSYNTGMGHATYSGSPQFANPSPPSTEGSGGNGWVQGIIAQTGEVYLLYISNFSQSGLAFQLTWQLTNGASLDCVVLPVELLGLSAAEEGAGVAVHWTTVTEHNSDYYIVERSTDTEHFAPVGTVEAAGESQQRIDYTYMDEHPLLGANYYRLKEVDLDGAYEYTPTVVVYFGKQDEPITAFPNPAEDVLNVAFQMPADGTAYAQVLDASGRVVRDRDTDLVRGPQTISLRTQDLGSGSYELRLFTTGHSGPKSVRFIKE